MSYTLPPIAAKMFLSHGHSFADASVCGIQKTFYRTGPCVIRISRGMILLYLYTYMLLLCIQRAAEHFVNRLCFFVVFISFRLTLVLMGSSTATAAAAATRNSTAFAPFPQPSNPCVDNDDVTTAWSLTLLAGPFIFSVYMYCVYSVYAYTMRG